MNNTACPQIGALAKAHEALKASIKELRATIESPDAELPAHAHVEGNVVQDIRVALRALDAASNVVAHAWGEHQIRCEVCDPDITQGWVAATGP